MITLHDIGVLCVLVNFATAQLAVNTGNDPSDVDFSQDVQLVDASTELAAPQTDSTFNPNMDFSGVRSSDPTTTGTSTAAPTDSTVTSTTHQSNSTRNDTTSTSTTPLFDYSTHTSVFVKAGVVLTRNTGTAYDHDIIAPALDVAFARARRDYNVIFHRQNFLYDVDPDPTDPTLLVGRTPGCWMWNASGMASYAVNSSVNVIIGPACTDDMRAVNELTTFFEIVTVTGAANLIDSTSNYRYLTRAGYNTFDMWNFAIKMFQNYGWTSVCMIYDYDDTQLAVEAASLLQNLKDSSLSPYDIRLNGTEFDDFDGIPDHLNDCGSRSRVIVFVMKGTLVRYFLVAATRNNMVNGEYIFMTPDLFLTDVLGQAGHWKQRDGYDKDALMAYQHLFVLSLRDNKNSQEYMDFATEVQTQSIRHYNKTQDTVVLNYYAATFHDSVLLLARAIRLARENPMYSNMPVPPFPDPLNVVRYMWNSTYQGASGLVYINPSGDRSDDLTIYQMTSTNGTFSVVAEYFGLVQEYSEIAPIAWRTPDGQPPLNQPVCGYLNDMCIDTVTAAAVGGSVGAAVVLGSIIALLFCYMRTKEVRDKANNDWIAEWEDLQMDVVGAGSSRMSINSTSSSSKSMSKPSLQSEDEGGSMGSNKRRKPPPSNGKLGFASWQGRLVMVLICEKQVLRLNRALTAEIKAVRNLADEHILKFLGAVLGPENIAVIGEYCSKGTLQDLLADETAKLDWIFRYSLLSDVVKGVSFLHSTIGAHGRLTSATCYVDGKFVLKVGNYGLPTLYWKAMPSELTFQYYVSLYWTAPELLDYPNGPGTPEGDVYAYGIILQEVILREEPYSMYQLEPEEIIAKVRTPELFFRPTVTSTDGALGLLSLMEQCWQEDPLERPRFPQIKTSLRQMTRGAVEKSNIVDLLITQMESYTADLERMVEEKTLAFQEEKTKTDALLNQILPSSVAEKLKKGEVVPPEQFESATIFFSDIVGFQTLALESTAIQIVDFLNDLYSLFDGTMPKFDVYKVETIQDSYMVASGLPVRNGLNHAKEQALLALTLMELIRSFRIRHRPDDVARLRVGLNSGPVVTSVIGLAVPRYCLFGDTVNTASRMESTGQGLKIQISPSTKAILDGFGMFTMKERGEIEVKGKGKIRTYWLLGEKDDALLESDVETPAQIVVPAPAPA